ncbi:MAG TPA: hypothetical protein VGZ00_05670 [Candidatus Baltobacteraceae bacterium]|nr:hypothetical protein [Candidatus Baltobacteraceae bacterium]
MFLSTWRLSRTLAVTALISFLSACSGGGGGSSPSIPPVSTVGVGSSASSGTPTSDPLQVNARGHRGNPKPTPSAPPAPVSGLSPAPVSQAAQSSDSFVAAIGVNTHFGYCDTAYCTTFSQVNTAITQLGVRHIRDGMGGNQDSTFYNYVNTLGGEGVHFDFIIGDFGQLTSSVIAQDQPQIMPFLANVSQSTESVEGPNEYDLGGYSPWASDLQAWMSMLYPTINGKYPVIGPSLDSGDVATLGNISGLLDYGNGHFYYGGHNPGSPGWGDTYPGLGTYGSIPYNVACVQQMSGTKPVIVTETGYDDLTTDAGWVTPAVKAKYTLRDLLDLWNAGIVRIYLYEMLDEGGQGYGLLHSSASPKPAYTALQSLLGALTDRGASFSTTPLSYGLSAGSTVDHLLLQKRDGSYRLVLWNEVSGWNTTTNTAVTVAPQTVTLSFAKAPSAISAATIGDTGAAATDTITSPSASLYQLPIDDHVTIITIKP